MITARIHIQRPQTPWTVIARSVDEAFAHMLRPPVVDRMNRRLQRWRRARRMAIEAAAQPKPIGA